MSVWLGRGIVSALPFFAPLRRRGTGPWEVPRSCVVFATTLVRLYRTTRVEECSPETEECPHHRRPAKSVMMNISCNVFQAYSQMEATLCIATSPSFVVDARVQRTIWSRPHLTVDTANSNNVIGRIRAEVGSEQQMRSSEGCARKAIAGGNERRNAEHVLRCSATNSN